MISQDTEERLARYLIDRLENVNTYILKKIGNQIKSISKLNAKQIQQIRSILLYNNDYYDILKALSNVSSKNVQDIYKIFAIIGQDSKKFAKKFYDYKKIEYVPYNKDIGLQAQVRAISEQKANDYLLISHASNIGYVLNGQFQQLEQVYQDVTNKAIEGIEQDEEDYNKYMEKTIKDIGKSGLVKKGDNGRVTRIEAVVYSNLLNGIRQVSNDINGRLGNEYGADGYEISVHSNPAPDHADIQGRQFTKEEYMKLEMGLVAKDIEGHIFNGDGRRPISQYNCYHKRYSIIIGASEPLYTDKELNKIQKDNNKGFNFDGRHYTNYEGTQIQRRIELEVRKQKDTHILAKASGNKEIMKECEQKIRVLKDKYNQLINASGLEPKNWRMSVSGYRK